MSEHPILFSAPMVRAILDGRKTMTRRVVTRGVVGRKMNGNQKLWPYLLDSSLRSIPVVCPYGQPGDKLWVRETWRPMSFGFNQIHGPVVRVQFAADMAMPVMPATEAQYDATHPDRSGLWRPSIHMPRWASRITLEVSAVRVERLQEITEDDARAEGCPKECPHGNARDWFEGLWDGINAERGFGWSVNPWVWVIGFEARKVEI